MWIELVLNDNTLTWHKSAAERLWAPPPPPAELSPEKQHPQNAEPAFRSAPSSKTGGQTLERTSRLTRGREGFRGTCRRSAGTVSRAGRLRSPASCPAAWARPEWAQAWGAVWGAEQGAGWCPQLSQAEVRGRARQVAPWHWLDRLLYARKLDLLAITRDHMASAVLSVQARCRRAREVSTHGFKAEGPPGLWAGPGLWGTRMESSVPPLVDGPDAHSEPGASQAGAGSLCPLPGPGQQTPAPSASCQCAAHAAHPPRSGATGRPPCPSLPRTGPS